MKVTIDPATVCPPDTPVQIILRESTAPDNPLGMRRTLAWKCYRGGRLHGSFEVIEGNICAEALVDRINALLAQAHSSVGHIAPGADLREPQIYDAITRVVTEGDRNRTCLFTSDGPSTNAMIVQGSRVVVEAA